MKKDKQDWTEADIISLDKNRVVESVGLEFKACDALRTMPKRDWRTEFAKDVSAFANSAGGILIYGIIENRETHEAASLDRGFDPRELDIEALEQIINSRIQRRIEGIRFKSVPLSGENEGRFVYVLDIPESGRAPHMANSRFYKRYNFESAYMEEHEVRERYRRESYPGRDVVEAWRDDAINPMIDSLESEARSLGLDIWSWNRNDETFLGLNRMSNLPEFSANKMTLSAGTRRCRAYYKNMMYSLCG